MRGNKAERQLRSRWVAALQEQEEHLPVRDAKSAESVISGNDAIAKETGVEIACEWEVCDTQARFNDSTRRRTIAHATNQITDLRPAKEAREAEGKSMFLDLFFHGNRLHRGCGVFVNRQSDVVESANAFDGIVRWTDGFEVVVPFEQEDRGLGPIRRLGK